jgi:hypothetical protein
MTKQELLKARSRFNDKRRLPSFERGCKGKIKLGRKRHKKNADRLANKYGHALGVYWCCWCGNYHATKKIDGEKIYEGFVHISQPNVSG